MILPPNRLLLWGYPSQWLGGVLSIFKYPYLPLVAHCLW